MSDEEYIKNISSISTEELFNSLEYYGYDSYYAELWRATIEELKKRIKEQPKGEWIYIGQRNRLKVVECTNCHKRQYGSMKYCGNCGADMRGVQDIANIKDLPICKECRFCKHCMKNKKLPKITFEKGYPFIYCARHHDHFSPYDTCEFFDEEADNER